MFEGSGDQTTSGWLILPRL